ncbi:MAG: type II toxin-antitoxin system HicA family toxin [Chloroflexi bacterium]|nr:MAG: type II toxin-antitoxin system HicA family toxin [Chloroflexota bacterium]
MPHVGPIKRKDLIYYMRRLGFEGPYSGGNHQYMVKIKENITVFVPNPHQGDIGESLLVRLLKQAKIDRATWEKL